MSTAVVRFEQLYKIPMKSNEIRPEEQNVDKIRKCCSERKAFRRKWLTTLCLSGRRMCITYQGRS